MPSKERSGDRLILVEQMGHHTSITDSPSPSWPSPRKWHFAAWLFTGWTAFWLTAVIAPCCDSLIANAQAGQESTSIEYRIFGAAGGGGQHELPCPELSHVQPAASALSVAPSFDTPSKAVNPPSLPAALPLFPAVARVKPPIGDQRPPIPYHQRTARLLI